MGVPAAARAALSSSERMVVLGGLGLGAASLVPWYKRAEFGFGVEGERTNGWQEPDAVLSQLGTVAAVALGIIVLVVGRQSSRPTAGGLSWGTLLTGGGWAVFGLIALKFALNMEDTTVGVYLGLTAAATQLYGAYVTRVEESRGGAPSSPERVGPPLAPPSPAPAPASVAVTPAASTAGGRAAPLPFGPSPPSSPPAAATPYARWPETSYFLATWLRPGSSVEAAVAAYRLAFAADPARQARLAVELRLLLDPSRTDAERRELLATLAPQLDATGASDVLGRMLQGLVSPPGP